MIPALTDTDPVAERVQLELFGRASVAKKLSLVRSLSQTVIGLSHRGLLGHASYASDRWYVVRTMYGSALADQMSRSLGAMQVQRDSLMQTPPDLLLALTPVVDVFAALGVPYFIGGSLASSAHGVPRATADVDLIAVLRDPDVSEFVVRLQSAYYADDVAIRRGIAGRSSFNLIHLATMLKIDVFIPKGDAYDQEVFRRLGEQSFTEGEGARKFLIASAEDILIAKLHWFQLGAEVSDRQWNDILGILKVQGDKLDYDYLERWVRLKNLEDLLSRALREIT
jgi:hypothetical protein